MEELQCVVTLRIGPDRGSALVEALIHHLAQYPVGDVVGEGHGDLVAHFGSGHQSRAPGHVHHPGEQLLDLGGLGGPDLILDDGVALDHVGGGATRVGVGVVDTGGVDHVLPQVVGAHVHELHGIQCASAQVGFPAGVGGDAVKDEVGAHDGHTAFGAHLVDGGGVPGVGEIHVVEVPGPGDELLGACALLGGAAEVDDGAVHVVGQHVVLQGHGGGEAAGAQQVVAAAVSRSAHVHGLLSGKVGLLAQTLQGIVLAQQAHHWLACAIGEGGGEGGGDVGDVLFNGEALCGQGLGQSGGGLGLPVGQLCKIPDILGQSDGLIRFIRDQLTDLFQFTHGEVLLYNTILKNLMVLGSRGQVKIWSGLPSSLTMPSQMKSTRSETSRAKAISWVTMRMVMPLRVRSLMTFRTSLTISGSRAEVGSSKSMTSGCMARARTMARRCFWPPDSFRGNSLALDSRPTRRRSSMASCWAWALGIFFSRMGARVTLSSTDILGKTLKFWKTMPTSWRNLGVLNFLPLMGSPLK